MPHRAPGSPGQLPPEFPVRQADRVLPAEGQRGDPASDRRRVPGVQRRPPVRGVRRSSRTRCWRPSNDTTIGLTIAGAMTPAGLGGCVIEMMDRGLVDFIISTGANLYHDLHYALNFTLRRGSPFVDDVELYEEGVIRIYDVLFPATVLLETDAYIRDFIVRSGVERADCDVRVSLSARPRSARAVFPGCEEHSVVARARDRGVPLYTSSPGDSSIGMNIAYHELMNGSRLMIDPNKDVNEVCAIVLAGQAERLRHSRRRIAQELLPAGAADALGGLRDPQGRQRLLHPDHDRSGGLGRTVRRDAGRSGQLGQGESRRSARYRRRVLRFDDRVPALLRVRRRVAERAPARGRNSCTSATRSSRR